MYCQLSLSSYCIVQWNCEFYHGLWIKWGKMATTTTERMFYGCHCHFVSFNSQSMIEFTVILHNGVARKHYLRVHNVTFIVGIDGFKQIYSWNALWIYLLCWKHWLCQYLYSSYASMNKGIICNCIEHILLLLCFWCLKMHQLLYTL